MNRVKRQWPVFIVVHSLIIVADDFVQIFALARSFHRTAFSVLQHFSCNSCNPCSDRHDFPAKNESNISRGSSCLPVVGSRFAGLPMLVPTSERLIATFDASTLRTLTVDCLFFPHTTRAHTSVERGSKLTASFTHPSPAGRPLVARQ